MLLAYEYSIRYKSERFLSNADGLTHFPTPTTTSSACLPGELVLLLNYLEITSISAVQMKQWTGKNPLLSRIKTFAMSGWPIVKLDAEFQPFLSRQQEISLMDGCLLWGSLPIIPPPGRTCFLEQLHQTHLGGEPNENLSSGICLVAKSGC